MIWAGAIFLVVGFVVIAHLVRIPARAAEVLRVTNGAVATIRDKQLDDLEKERAMRQTSLRLLALFAILTVTSALALAIPVGLLYGAGAAGWLDFDAVIACTVSWQFLVGATVIGFALWAILARSPRR